MSSNMAQRLRSRYYDNYQHPALQLKNHVGMMLRPHMTLMDAGCGRDVPLLREFQGRAARLVGIDIVAPRDIPPGIEYFQQDLATTGLPEESVDLIVSKAVFEHLDYPERVLDEMRRVLRPGGRAIVLTPSKWDYASLIAMVVPNRFHPAVVEQVEGRPREDTFPTRFRCNTEGAIKRMADSAGLKLEDIQFVNQYPNYFLFNGPLFFLGMLYERVTTRFHALRRLRGWIMFTLCRETEA